MFQIKYGGLFYIRPIGMTMALIKLWDPVSRVNLIHMYKNSWEGWRKCLGAKRRIRKRNNKEEKPFRIHRYHIYHHIFPNHWQILFLLPPIHLKVICQRSMMICSQCQFQNHSTHRSQTSWTLSFSIIYSISWINVVPRSHTTLSLCTAMSCGECFVWALHSPEQERLISLLWPCCPWRHVPPGARPVPH